MPTAPAVAGALEAFDGVHRTQLPMKDSPAARAILNPRNFIHYVKRARVIRRE